MKKTLFASALLIMTACGNNQQQLVIGEPEFTGEQSFIEVNEPATPKIGRAHV